MDNSMHVGFQKRLAKSAVAVEIVSEWLRLHNFKTKPEELTIPDNPGYNLTGPGDIRVMSPEGERGTVEVKHRGVQFTDRWPYPSAWLIRQGDYARKMASDWPIFSFVLLSKDYRHAAVIGADIDNLFVENDYDSQRNTSVPKLSASRESFAYHQVPAAAIERAMRSLKQ